MQRKIAELALIFTLNFGQNSKVDEITQASKSVKKSSDTETSFGRHGSVQ